MITSYHKSSLSESEEAGLPWWVVVMLMGLSVALYANTFGNGWTYDDFPVIVNNPDVTSWPAFLKDIYPGRPVRELTYLIDHILFGMEPGGWRIQQILWHGLTGVFICSLIHKMSGSLRTALITAMLFLCHPVQVEVVANISHRKESLMLCFALVSLLSYRKSFYSATLHSRCGWVVLALFSFVMSVYSKQTGAMILPVIFCYEYLFVQPEKRILARPKVIAWTLVVGIAVFTWWSFSSGDLFARYSKGMNGLLHLREGWTGEITFWVYLLTLLKSWAFMWFKLVWPANLALEYRLHVPEGFLDPWVLAACMVLVFIVLFFFKMRKSDPLIAFAIAWFALFWLPVSNVWPLTYFAADRYLYAPNVGFCLLAAIILTRAANRWRSEVYILCSVILIVLSILSWKQNRVWRDSYSLWTHAVQVSPKASFALNNLGFISLQRGDLRTAEALLLRATENPYNPNPHDNLGWLYEKQGKMPLAAKHYLEFIRVAGNGLQYRDRVATLKSRLALQ